MFESDFDTADLQSTDDVEFLDTPDVSDVETTDLDDGFYHADHMSDEEVARIDDMWDDTPESFDVEPYQAVRASDMDKQQNDIGKNEEASDMLSSLSLEEKFASDIEVETLQEIGNPFASEVQDVQPQAEYDKELFDALTDDLPRETLEHLKEGLKSGDREVYDYFGLSGTADDGSGEYTLSPRR